MVKKKGSVLVIDDNEELLIALKLFLSPHFAEVVTEKNPNLIPSILDKDSYDVILLDMNFSAGVSTGNEGIYWMNKIIEKDPFAVIVFITAFGDVELAVKAIKEGATDFIQKTWDEKKMLSTIQSAYKIRLSKLEIANLKNKQKHLSDNIDKSYNLCIGQSEIMEKIFSTIDKVAKTDANILVLGENGTGKEVIAREIHKRSLRVDDIFVSVDITSLSETLFESELFGHIKGSFTDAKSDRPGRFEIASGGTLFLDEIGNIPKTLQSKLLSTIQNREITRIGSNNPVSIDIRLISATNKPVYQMVEEGTFREDLLYRINTIQIEIPPLRDRQEDIKLLAYFFLKTYSEKYKKEMSGISKTAIKMLQKHSWYGNVRELQNTIEKAVILTENNILQANDFFFQTKPVSRIKELENFNIMENEKQIIKLALEKYKGNMSLTSKMLGINRSTLYDKIKKYEL